MKNSKSKMKDKDKGPFHVVSVGNDVYSLWVSKRKYGESFSMFIFERLQREIMLEQGTSI